MKVNENCLNRIRQLHAIDLALDRKEPFCLNINKSHSKKNILLLFVLIFFSRTEIYPQKKILIYSNINLQFTNENSTGLARLATDYIYGLRIEVNSVSKPVFVGLYRTFQLEIMEKSDSFKLDYTKGNNTEYTIVFDWFMQEGEGGIDRNVIQKMKYSGDSVVLINLNGKKDTFLRKEIFFGAFNYRVTSSLRSPVIKIIGKYCSASDSITIFHDKLILEGKEYTNVKLIDTVLTKYSKSRSYVFYLNGNTYFIYQGDEGKYTIIRINANALNEETKYLICPTK